MTFRRRPFSRWFCLAALPFLACEGKTAVTAPGAGGVAATGGAVATGGIAWTGGASSQGGVSATGGNSGTGGGGRDAAIPSDGASGSRAQEVCQRWTADRASLAEGTWTGNAASCTAGDLTGSGRPNALKVVNLYRFLAGMPAVAEDPALDTLAQGCALLQTANNSLSHTPPATWSCYTAEFAAAAGKSSISSGPLVKAIDGFMAEDAANADTMGHRRWIFANSLGPVGFGMAKASCFYQVGGTGKAAMPFVPWPPSGPVPLAALTTTKVDTNGWTVQSDGVDVTAGTVAVLDDGQPAAVTQTTLGANYGSKYALRFVPSGWKIQAGHTYEVAVSGTTIRYTVQPVDCATN